MRRLSEEEIKATIRSAYRALLSGDVEGMLSFCMKDTTLNWGPFIFKGRAEIRRWAKELRKMFPTMRIRETELTVHGSKATHKFVIDFTAPNGQRGRLPVMAEYNFKDGKIQHIQMTLSLGVLTFDEEEIKRLGLPRLRL